MAMQQPATTSWLHRVTDSDVWWSFKSSPTTVAAAAATLFIFLMAFLAPLLAPHKPFDLATLSLSDGLKPPVLVSPDGDWAFPLGTDDQGRDMLSDHVRPAHLAAGGLRLGVVAMVIGVALGLVSGYVGGATDALIMRVADVQLTFPAILVALLIDGVARGSSRCSATTRSPCSSSSSPSASAAGCSTRAPCAARPWSSRTRSTCRPRA